MYFWYLLTNIYLIYIMEKYLGYEKHLIILGEKLNNFIPAKSQIELNKYIDMAKSWIKSNQNKSYNFYKK